MLHRSRAVPVRPGRERLAGTVEIDETYIGGRDPGVGRGKGRGDKVLTGIAVEFEEPSGYGRCRIAPLADASAASGWTDSATPMRRTQSARGPSSRRRAGCGAATRCASSRCATQTVSRAIDRARGHPGPVLARYTDTPGARERRSPMAVRSNGEPWGIPVLADRASHVEGVSNACPSGGRGLDTHGRSGGLARTRRQPRPLGTEARSVRSADNAARTLCATCSTLDESRRMPSSRSGIGVVPGRSIQWAICSGVAPM
jgi:hypothetical protein